MQLFFNDHITPDTVNVVLDQVESQHIIKVLRKNTGDTLWITDGKGGLYKTEITQPHHKKCEVEVIQYQHHKNNRPYFLEIGIAPTKNIDRFEWFLEKSAEIGIDRIVPLLCERSERKVLKAERLQKILVTAMKQSAQYYLPQLEELQKYEDYIEQPFEGQQFIAHCIKDEKQSLKNVVLPRKPIQVLIGPEGDFSLSEVQKALEKGFEPVSLGANRLRTETAGIVATHTVNITN
jgi:16S rRNA (uracil1498-N3)-methyltransferase